jgi:saccharopine dehydrogenase-like NADP-dependent oxidoreductase
VEIPSGGKILEETKKVQFMPEFQLEAYPNRDSLSYLDKYGISSRSAGVKSTFRGTLRHQGFSEGAKTLIKLGYLSTEPLEILDPTRDHSPLSWVKKITSYLKYYY